MRKNEISIKQECILVGCVPSAAVAVSWGCLPSPGGVLPSGGCFLLGVLPSQGVSAPRGSASRGVSAPGGGGIPACTEADTPSVNRMTDRCKNITFATPLQKVIKGHQLCVCNV